MESKYAKQFKKGILEIIILKLLSKKEMYGYQIVSEMEERGNVFNLREGTLYPILYRLEDDGMIESRWEQSASRKVPRKYYAITPSGKDLLKEATEQWLEFAYTVEKVLKD